MLPEFPLPLEVTWLVKYRSMAYRTTLARLLERFGRDVLVRELVMRLEDAGPNVVSIATARNWERSRAERRLHWPQVV
jgi:hypothetical protein